MKQVSTTRHSSLLSSILRRSITCQKRLTNYCYVILLVCFGMFSTGCKKADLQGNSQTQDIMNSSQKQSLQKKCVPFKAEFKVNAVITQDGDPQIVDITGTGEGTHIGKSSYIGHTLFTGPTFVFTGYGTIIAANGDKIFVTGIEGPGPDVDFTTGNIVLTVHFIITGGTGRFTGATGSYTDIAHASIYTTAGTDSLEGTICY